MTDLYKNVEVVTGFKSTDGKMFDDLGSANKHQLHLDKIKFCEKLIEDYSEACDEFFNYENRESVMDFLMNETTFNQIHRFILDDK